MSGATEAGAPGRPGLTLIGAMDAAVCVDGVCEWPPAAVQTASFPEPSSNIRD